MKRVIAVITLLLFSSCFLETSKPVNTELSEESTDRLCSDGLDNDEDGYIDCIDQDCYTVDVCDPTNYSYFNDSSSESEPNTIPMSNEEDEELWSPLDCSEDSKDIRCAMVLENTATKCTDGVDNDLNGLVDCYDPGCGSFDFCHGPHEETFEECQDEVDNDEDGRIDCEDSSCRNFTLCQEVMENTLKSCSDGIDNDEDGVIDCDESACKSFIICNKPVENTEVQCKDGVDNDNNGATDCDDRKCKVFSFCAETTKN
ncbi:MAG: hypothetical protein OCC49_03615 [Fibrobacterales bacterium]